MVEQALVCHRAAVNYRRETFLKWVILVSRHLLLLGSRSSASLLSLVQRTGSSKGVCGILLFPEILQTDLLSQGGCSGILWLPSSRSAAPSTQNVGISSFQPKYSNLGSPWSIFAAFFLLLLLSLCCSALASSPVTYKCQPFCLRSIGSVSSSSVLPD